MSEQELIELFDKVYRDNPGKRIDGIKVVDRKSRAVLTFKDPRKNIFENLFNKEILWLYSIEN